MFDVSSLKLKAKTYLKFKYLYLRYVKFIDFSVSDVMKKSEKSILIVSHDMSRTGAPILLLHIVKALHLLSWNITVVTMRAGPLLKEFSQYSSVLVSNDVHSFEHNLDILKSYKVKKAFVNSTISGYWTGALKEHGFSVVSLVHELPGAILAWNAMSRAQMMALKSDVIVFPSNFVKDKFESLVGRLTTSSKILPQGLFLKLESVPEKSEAQKEIRKTFRFNDKPIVLNVASGNHRKGFDLFVDLAAMEPNLNFVWVGEIDHDIYQHVSLEHKLNEMKNLHLLGYISNLSVLMNLYSAACSLALTSREEPFGSIVLEAMNAGTPIIGFRDVGGFQDVVKCGETGYLVDVGDTIAMLEKIRLVSSNQNLALEFEKKTKLLAKTHDFERYVAKLLAFLERNDESV